MSMMLIEGSGRLGGWREELWTRASEMVRKGRGDGDGH